MLGFEKKNESYPEIVGLAFSSFSPAGLSSTVFDKTPIILVGDVCSPPVEYLDGTPPGRLSTHCRRLMDVAISTH
jgi:hypothetical protein